MTDNNTDFLKNLNDELVISVKITDSEKAWDFINGVLFKEEDKEKYGLEITHIHKSKKEFMKTEYGYLNEYIQTVLETAQKEISKEITSNSNKKE